MNSAARPRGACAGSLLVSACLAAIALFLLATATANTDLFAGHYDVLVLSTAAWSAS